MNTLFQRRIINYIKLDFNGDSLLIMNKFYNSFNNSSINWTEESSNRDKILNIKQVSSWGQHIGTVNSKHWLLHNIEPVAKSHMYPILTKQLSHVNETSSSYCNSN